IGGDAEYVDAAAGAALTGVVVRARIAVVARAAVGPDRARAAAGRRLAGVGLRAGVAVVAGGAVGLRRARAAAGRRVAGARVVALIRRGAGDGVRAGTDSTLAGVGLGAGIAVGAGGAVGLRRARAETGRRIAGARVVALIRGGAGDGVRAGTDSTLAGVGLRAGIAVGARGAVGLHRARA